MLKVQACRRCGATWHAHEEKLTDVSIAVQMLDDAADDLFDTAKALPVTGVA